MRIKAAIVIFIILAVASPALATNYYVDQTSGSDSNTGLSNAQAWKTLAKVNSFSFSAGDDVYLKCGETWPSESLTVDWSGTSGNYAIIGSYYMESGTEILGVSGTRPTLQGNISTFPVSEWSALVQVRAPYVRVENIRLIDSHGAGVNCNSLANNLVLDNLYIDHNYFYGISLPSISDFVVQNCEITDVDTNGTGAAFNAPLSHRGKVLYSYIHDVNALPGGGGEGLNAYRSNDIEFAYNRIVDTSGALIYLDQAVRPHIHHNIIYYTNDSSYWRYGTYPAAGIWAADEPNWVQQFTAASIHDNLIANVGWGFRLETQAQGTTLKDSYIVNNTIILNSAAGGYCFEINSNTHSNSTIQNNICYNTGGTPAIAPTGAGITWGYNIWSATQAAVDDDAEGTGDVYSATLDLANSTWDGSITLNPSDFYIGASSDAIDAGNPQPSEFVNGFDSVNTAMATVPYSVVTLSRTDYGWDSGAVVYQGGYTPPPPQPGTITRDDAPSTNSATATNTVTVSHTTTVDPDFARVTIFWRNDTARTVSSVTYDGNGATSSLASTNAYTYGKVATYYLLDASLPTAGPHNIIVTMSGTCFAIDVVVETFSGVKQQAPEATTNTDDTDGNGTVTSNITTLTNGAWVLDSVINNYGWVTATAGTNQTEQYNSTTVGKRVGVSSKQVDTASATSMSWTVDGTVVEHLVEAIAPAADASCATDSVDVDQSGNTGNDVGLSGFARGNSFQVATAGTLSAIRVGFSAGFSGNATIRWGTATDLTTCSAPTCYESTEDVSASPHKFTFSTKGAVSTGTTYYFGIIENSGTISLDRSASDTYANGAYRFASGAGWNMDSTSAVDSAFEIFLCDIAAPDPAPSITDIGTLNGAAFDDAQVLDIGIGDSVYILFALSEQIINFGTPEQSRVVYQVDRPASTDYYGAFVGQIQISGTYYLEYEIRGGYTFDGTNWTYVNAMRETADLAISSISIGQATMEDGDGNQIDVTLGANTDPGTITISCPGIIKTTDPTAESLLNYDKVVLLSGSAAWTPTEDYLTIYLKGTYSGDITLTGVSTPCRVINPGKATGTNNWGSCTQHNQFPLLWR